MNIQLLNAEQVLAINQAVCAQEKQTSHCRNHHALESAIGAAFYPGVYPFQYGGLASVAGALCYFLTKAHAFLDGNKRTAGIASTIFLDINGYELHYAIDIKKSRNAWAEIIEQAAQSVISKETLMKWYETHKIKKKSK
jgi:death-on-curing family protein